MREAFIPKKFNDEHADIIAKANEVLADYNARGFTMTLRQLYYQFVARGWLPNKVQSYKRLGGIISDARLAGRIDWAMMEDRLRQLERIPRWESPSSIVEAVANQYQEDLWIGQKNRVEVWIEKDALIGVIENVCREFRLDHFACRGYASQSAQYEAGQRFRRYMKDGQTVTVLHLGDHDPSGIDMTRDNGERLSLFSRYGVDVQRIALNMDQVEQYNPPPNPAKETDARSGSYIERFGGESWELDALSPDVIEQLIRDAVEPLIDDPLMEAAKKKEAENKATLQAISDNWDGVREYIDGLEEDED